MVGNDFRIFFLKESLERSSFRGAYVQKRALVISPWSSGVFPLLASSPLSLSLSSYISPDLLLFV